MDSKEIRIAELEKKILEIKNEKDYAFALIKVIPDCGGGIRDSEETIAVSMEIEIIVHYSKKEFNYNPHMDERNSTDSGKPCDTWYMIKHTKIEIL